MKRAVAAILGAALIVAFGATAEALAQGRADGPPAGGASTLVLMIPVLIVVTGLLMVAIRQQRRGEPLHDLLPKPPPDIRTRLGPPPLAPEPAPDPKPVRRATPASAPMRPRRRSPERRATDVPRTRRRDHPTSRPDALGYVSVPAVDRAYRGDLKRQVKLIRRVCDALGLALLDLIPEDESTAQAPSDRPGYKRIVSRLDRGDATCLVTTSVERLAASPDEWATLLDHLDEIEVRLILVEDALDTGVSDGAAEAWALAFPDAP